VFWDCLHVAGAPVPDPGEETSLATCVSLWRLRRHDGRHDRLGVRDLGQSHLATLVVLALLVRRLILRMTLLVQAGMLLLTQGVLYGVGACESASCSAPTYSVLTPNLVLATAVSYAPVISYMTEWFVRRTGFAYGVLTAGSSFVVSSSSSALADLVLSFFPPGTSVAGVVFPFIISSLLQRFGSKGTLWGLVSLVSFPPARRALARLTCLSSLRQGAVLAVLIGALLPFIKGRIPDPPKYNRREPNRHVAPKFDLSFAKKKIFWILSIVRVPVPILSGRSPPAD
jgi:hypothetical protein